jgi:hypothetical protein
VGRVRLNAHLAARLVVLGGGCAVIAGVYLLWSLAIALMVGGVSAVAVGLLLIDVDAKRRPARG